MDRAYLSELEREDGNATVDLLNRLAASLGVVVGEFFMEPAAGAERPKSLPSGRRPRSRKTRASGCFWNGALGRRGRFEAGCKW